MNSTNPLDDRIRGVRRSTVSPLGLLAGLTATSLLLAGCGGGGSDTKTQTPSSAYTSGVSSPEKPQTWPLTGLTVANGATSALKHPVIVAKIDNSGEAPQAGLSDADMVVEELVEGGITRLAAFYYSKLPDEVGPMRSMRFSDIGIVKPVDADIITSGAAPITINKIKGAGITFFGESNDGFHRSSARPAPYNLMASAKTLAAGVKQKKAVRPHDYLTWGPSTTQIPGVRATSIDATFSGAHASRWTYAGGHYQLTDGNAPKSDEFVPDTVLVLRVKTVIAPYKDPAGNPVPETVFTGKGKAMIFHGGKVLRGTWTKDGLDAPVKLSTAAGSVKVPAGHVWIELVPTNGGDVTFK